MTTRDRLLLLKPGFEDPAFPGQRFYCWHCAHAARAALG
jgi:hypothetical protein